MVRVSGCVKGALKMLIRAYQLSFSALMGRQCRFYPTCSDYAIQAIDKHGVCKGSLLAGLRICRCGPQPRWLGGGHGFDPVPEVWHERLNFSCMPIFKRENGNRPTTPKQD